MPATRPAHLQYELAFPATTLSAFTREEKGVTRYYIGGTASSTMEDLKGSVISTEAQVIMMEKLRGLAKKMSDVNSGMTAWLSHEYTVPEDCLGAFTAASIVSRADSNGQEFIDLDIECRLVDFSSNPRAEAAYKQVQDGIRHGWSIGAYFKDIEWLSDDPDSEDFWKYKVTDIELLEISLVGIPANQRAWVRALDSARDFAVKRAEQIASENISREHKRELVTRSIIERRGFSGARNLAMAEDFRERARSPFLDAENVKALTRAAEVLEAPAKRDDGQSLSPDDMRDRISLGISHMAKAVGHGLCIKSATHVARAIDCMSAAMQSNGGEAEPATTVNGGEPEGDTDPNAILNAQATVIELEAKAEQLKEEQKQSEVALREARELLAKVESDIAEAAKQLAEQCERDAATTVDRNHELSMLETDIGILKAERDLLKSQAEARHETEAAEVAARQAEAKAAREETEKAKAELQTIVEQIEKRKTERLGRIGRGIGNEMEILAQSGDTYVKPEHYKASHAEQQAALQRMASGKRQEPMTGRDMALNQEK